MLKHFRVPPPFKCSTGSKGFTLTEVLITVLVLGILAAVTAPTIKFGNNPVKDTSNRIAGHLKLLRAKALSQTSAYRIRAFPVGGVPLALGATADRNNTAIIVEKAPLCSAPDADWTRDPGFATEDLLLDPGVEINQVEINNVNNSTNAWSICYSSRGLATQNLELTLNDDNTSHKQRKITVFPGGGVDVEEL